MTTTIGSLSVTSSCQPQPLIGGLAFTLACGGTLTNATQRQVAVAVQAVPAPGGSGPRPLAPGVYPGPPTVPPAASPQHLLAPGQSLTLPDPGAGSVWQVVDVTRGQAEGIGFGLLVLILGGAGLAGYGAYALGRDLVQRRRRRGR
jgi:hypothetical protein